MNCVASNTLNLEDNQWLSVKNYSPDIVSSLFYYFKSFERITWECKAALFFIKLLKGIDRKYNKH